MKEKRGQLVWDTLVPWIVVVGFIVLMGLVYLGISGKLGSIGEYVRSWLRFG